jgi:nucleotide-binding universal stress UspA family protein
VTLVVVGIGLWLAIGVVLGLVMNRRGYSGFGWGVIGAVLGPIGVLIALAFDAPPRRERVAASGTPGRGAVDVIVGIDGSHEATASARAAHALLGERIRRTTFACVTPSDATAEQDRSADAMLREARQAVTSSGLDPELIVLHGRPSDALREHAINHGFHVLAIGYRRRGASRAILGSVASNLVRRSELPLIVAGHGLTAKDTSVSTDASTTMA